jgi:hypothetical protein
MPRSTRSSGDEPAPDGLLPGGEAFERPFADLVGDDGVEEQLPIALVADPAVGMQHPDHRHAKLAKLGRQTVDRFDDAARGRYLGRAARRAEHGLHVDHDQRGSLGIQPIEQMIAAAPLQHAIDDLLAHRHRMHQITAAKADAM